MISNSLKFLLFVFVFVFSGCARDVFWNHDAGDISFIKNGQPWVAEASTNVIKDFKDFYAISISNTGEAQEPPHGTISIQGIPYATGILEFEFEPNIEQFRAYYTHDILHESTALGTYSLWLEYPALHFEITHLSKNEREAEGFLNMAFVVDNRAILDNTTETDTIYFEGDFSVKIPRKR